MWGIILPIILILISGAIIWRSTDGFELASDFLGRRLTKGVKGATINAIASSMPEFLSTIFFLFYLKDSNGFSGGVGITGGSAVFNILIIPIAIYFVVRFSKGAKYIPVERRTFLRDGIILLIMTGFVAWVVSVDLLTWWHGLLLTAPYLAYLIWLFGSHRKVLPSKDDFKYIPKTKAQDWLNVVKLDLERLALKGRTIRTTNAWTLLILSTVVMIVGTWVLVFATDQLGEEIGIPILFISVILSAAASSIPDTMISLRDAKKGNYEDAFSNALGSNIFDISFALGFPLLLYTILRGSIEMDPEISAASFGIWLSLFAVTLFTILVFSVGKPFNLPKVIILVLLYLCFIAFIII